MNSVTAIIPAKDCADSVAATINALKPQINNIIVVNDGSSDDTAAQAVQATGVMVLSHPNNKGKAAAITTGVKHAPNAEIYLLVDADTGESAKAALALLEPLI